MSKRAWLVFAAIQTIGCVLASYGTVYSESAFVRGSWPMGFLLLSPGNLPAMALGQKLIHVRTEYLFFPVAVGCNALLWLTCSAVWRIVRHDRHGGASYRYGIAFAATGLLFAVINTAHFLRGVTCYDCFLPYGLPFTFYRDGGEGGGRGLQLRGLAADVAVVIVSAGLLVRLWQWLEDKRIEQ